MELAQNSELMESVQALPWGEHQMPDSGASVQTLEFSAFVPLMSVLLVCDDDFHRVEAIRDFDSDTVETDAEIYYRASTKNMEFNLVVSESTRV